LRPKIVGSLQRKEPKTAARDRFDDGRQPNVVVDHSAPLE